MQRRGEVTLDHVLEWIPRQQGGPFFLCFTYGTHTTRTIHRTLPQPVSRGPLQRSIAYVDATVGKLFDYLREQGPV